MRQADLNRAVARATGESVSFVKRLGFMLADPDAHFMEDVTVIDWDLVDEARRRPVAMEPSCESALV